MKCPSCGYVHGGEWVVKEDGEDEYIDVVGSEGPFYRGEGLALPPKGFQQEIVVSTFGCPKCYIVFFDRWA